MLSTLAFALLAATASADGNALPVIEDDYPRALAEAQKADKPLVVDLWATWCHSCLSMKNFVFKDPRVVALKDKAVFVAIDTEKSRNAAIVQKLRPTAWPTFLVIDAKSEKLLARLLGSATAPEFVTFVDDGIAAAQKLAQAQSPALAVLAEADALLSAGNRKDAIVKYESALADASLSPSTRGRAALNLTQAYSGEDQAAKCAQVAKTQADKAKDTYYEPALVATYYDCGSDAGLSWQPGEVDAIAKRIQGAIDSPTLNLNADDKSDLFDVLSQIAKKQGNDKAAQGYQQARLDMLETAAKNAPNAEARRTFDAHRSDVYLTLGRPDDAIALLTKSEKEAPTDYNPPARLARAYLAKNDLKNAKAAIGRASKLVYGPRAAVIFILQGDIAVKASDYRGAKEAYAKASEILSQQQPTPGVVMRIKDIKVKISNLP